MLPFGDISKSFGDISKSFGDISKSFGDISKSFGDNFNSHIFEDILKSFRVIFKYRCINNIIQPI